MNYPISLLSLLGSALLRFGQLSRSIVYLTSSMAGNPNISLLNLLAIYFFFCHVDASGFSIFGRLLSLPALAPPQIGHFLRILMYLPGSKHFLGGNPEIHPLTPWKSFGRRKTLPFAGPCLVVFGQFAFQNSDRWLWGGRRRAGCRRRGASRKLLGKEDCHGPIPKVGERRLNNAKTASF